jgi:hypothetical protein
MAIATLRDELRAAVESRHSRHHPYYQLWREGKLPREAIAGWVQEHYHFTKDIPWLSGPKLCDVPYEDIRDMARRGIAEEMDPKDPHINILLRFGEAMGLDPEQVKRSKPLPTTQALLDWTYILTRHRSIIEAVAGLNIGLESQPPQLYGTIVSTAPSSPRSRSTTVAPTPRSPTSLSTSTPTPSTAAAPSTLSRSTPAARSSASASSSPRARAPRSAGSTLTASTFTTSSATSSPTTAGTSSRPSGALAPSTAASGKAPPCAALSA